MSGWQKVSEEEFLEFLKSYPCRLESDVSGVDEPPIVHYNDFTLGDWPASMVATFRPGVSTLSPSWHVRPRA